MNEDRLSRAFCSGPDSDNLVALAVPRGCGWQDASERMTVPQLLHFLDCTRREHAAEDLRLFGAVRAGAAAVISEKGGKAAERWAKERLKETRGS